MKCSECKYSFKTKLMGKEVYACNICHIVATKECQLPIDDVSSLAICYNCKYWIGGGDWGLSCKMNYYNTSSNGFDPVCTQYERKTEV